MKQFLKTFAAVCAALAFFALIVVVIVAMAVGGDDRPEVKKESLMTLNLGVPISDKPLSNGIEDAVKSAMGNGVDQTVTLRTLLESIDHAASDKRIKALYIHGDVARAGYFSGWAALKEVREAVERFKASGKPVIAYQTALNEANWYMMSLADELYLNPLGYIEFNGFAAQIMFYKGAFEKYGVDVQVTRVGKYKSAVEPYLLDSMSDPNREQIELLLNDLFDEAIKGIATARGVEPAALRELADTKAFLTAEEAAAAGYVDKIVFYDDVLARLREITGTEVGEKIENQIDAVAFYEASKKESSSKNKVAVIYAEGGIQSGNSEREVGGDLVARLLREAREDDDVKAVVLRVNSPGGSALASDVIQRETRLLKEAKPLVVSMGTVAASGGYWISTYADEIFAQPNTVTGSIGVFGMFANFKSLMNEHGINVDVAKTSPMADIGTNYRPLTEQELAVMQSFVDEIYVQFLDKVSEGRNLDRDQVAEMAQGRVWSGTQALELGLIDKLGGLNDAIASAAQRANLSDDYQVTEVQQAREFMDEILEKMGFSTYTAPSPFTSELIEAWETLNALQDRQGIYARLPYDLDVR